MWRAGRCPRRRQCRPLALEHLEHKHPIFFGHLRQHGRPTPRRQRVMARPAISESLDEVVDREGPVWNDKPGPAVKCAPCLFVALIVSAGTACFRQLSEAKHMLAASLSYADPEPTFRSKPPRDARSGLGLRHCCLKRPARRYKSAQANFHHERAPGLMLLATDHHATVE